MSKDDICPSCGVPYVDHLGLIPTCAALRTAQADLAAAVKVIEAARGLDCKHGDCDDCISICWEETVLHEALHEWDEAQKGRTE